MRPALFLGTTALVLALVLTPTLAHADVMRTFTLGLPSVALSSNTTSYGNEALAGDLQLDASTGVVEDASVYSVGGPFTFDADTITDQGGVAASAPTGGGSGGPQLFLNSSPYYFVDLKDDTSGALFTLTLPGGSLVGYNGSGLCSQLCQLTIPTSASGTAEGTAESGTATLSLDDDGPAVGNFPLAPPPSITPTAVTAEPSSLYLFGSGLIGVSGIVRRRFR